MSKIKLLVHEVFEKAKKESEKDSKNGRAEYLSVHFEDEWNFQISEKTLVRYYDDIKANNNRNIDTPTLNIMSQYLGFQNFSDFSNTETSTKVNEDSSVTSVKVSIDEEEKSLTEKLSQIVVNITTTPIFKFPEFLTKQSNLGIIGVIICAGFWGSKLYKDKTVSSDKIVMIDSLKSLINSDIPNINIPQTLVSRNNFSPTTEKKVITQKQCMYWNGKGYVPEDCNQPLSNLIAIDMKKVVNFKKITTPDTITAKSLDKVWYSKYNNEVEFFTADGENPENGKDLKPVSKHIYEKYISN